MTRNIMALIIALIIVGAVFYIISANQATAPGDIASVPIEAVYQDRVVYAADTMADISPFEKDCRARGGKINTCGSACAPEAEVCAQVCAVTCDLKAGTPEENNGFKNMEPAEFTAEITKLAAVGDYSGDGIATREYDGSAFIHTVTARLADPEANKFYEGWLVIPEAGKFFSTGRMEKSGGGYALTYTNQSDQSDYYQVVVTEESLANGFDNKPEVHVLEGEFKNH